MSTLHSASTLMILSKFCFYVPTIRNTGPFPVLFLGELFQGLLAEEKILFLFLLEVEDKFHVS